MFKLIKHHLKLRTFQTNSVFGWTLNENVKTFCSPQCFSPNIKFLPSLGISTVPVIACLIVLCENKNCIQQINGRDSKVVYSNTTTQSGTFWSLLLFLTMLRKREGTTYILRKFVQNFSYFDNFSFHHQSKTCLCRSGYTFCNSNQVFFRVHDISEN